MSSTRHDVGTIAWVESPFQLLSAIEATFAGALVPPVEVHLRGPTSTYRPLLDLVARHPVPSLRIWAASEPSVAADAGQWATELAIGDLFSGQAAAILARCRDLDLVVLDDGSSTHRALELVGRRTASLVRPRSSDAPARWAAGLIAHRLVRARSRGRMRAVSGLPILPGSQIAVRVDGHDFEWSRSVRVDVGFPDTDLVVLGTALAADGLIGRQHYDEWLRRQFDGSRGRAVYLPHRRDATHRSRQIRRLGGTVGSAGGLPVELVARNLAPGTRVVTLPSTTVMTVPLVAPDVRLECWDVPAYWWAPSASPAVRRLVDGIASSSSSTFDLFIESALRPVGSTGR
ncbi:hypothetical protein BDK89_2940 [Ilumatobacter fluminis]|uniref:Uncharacterized protein n=1 Tax=Ilumatobacter fluminis TaxID=467091 RepID=A0A4R7I197_9ACTN|nr:hypothetical protein [Ilumatobacter fluminis]TDT17332.1 hypothetical protein BDK89_2940 [Ilumatobacter fluminis]